MLRGRGAGWDYHPSQHFQSKPRLITEAASHHREVGCAGRARVVGWAQAGRTGVFWRSLSSWGQVSEPCASSCPLLASRGPRIRGVRKLWSCGVSPHVPMAVVRIGHALCCFDVGRLGRGARS